MTGRARIGFFLPHLRHGGAERVVLLLMQHLDRTRFQPVLIVQRREGDYLKLLPADVEVIALRHRRPPGCIPELARVLTRHRIDLVYTATNATNIYAALAARLSRRRSKVVISEHTPLEFSLSQAKWLPLRRAAIRLAYPLADRVVAPLDRIGTEMTAFLGASAPAFRCLPNPVVESLAPPRDQPDRARRVVSVGRLAKVKRFDRLIEAFAMVHAEAPDMTLLLLGDGPERAGLERLAADLGLGAAVVFAGYADDVPARLAGCDLFVCTSEREGFGNAIVEAMAAGVPVISVDCPFGPRLLVQGGAAGCLLEADDAATIARAMAEVAADRARREGYAAAARAVAGAFSVARAVAAYEQAFDEILHDQTRQTDNKG